MSEKDSKTQVISRLLEVARFIRRRGTPGEAEAVLPYERQLAEDLEKRIAELKAEASTPEAQAA